MKKLLLATHGSFASGAKSTLQFILGDVADITCIDAYVDPEENPEEVIAAYFAQVSESDEVIIMTDIKGGSVNQKMIPYAVKHNCILIAGFNLPLLVALALAPEGISREEVKQIITDAKDQMELMELEPATAADEETDEMFFAG